MNRADRANKARPFIAGTETAELTSIVTGRTNSLFAGDLEASSDHIFAKVRGSPNPGDRRRRLHRRGHSSAYPRLPSVCPARCRPQREFSGGACPRIARPARRHSRYRLSCPAARLWQSRHGTFFDGFAAIRCRIEFRRAQTCPVGKRHLLRPANVRHQRRQAHSLQALARRLPAWPDLLRGIDRQGGQSGELDGGEQTADGGSDFRGRRREIPVDRPRRDLPMSHSRTAACCKASVIDWPNGSRLRCRAARGAISFPTGKRRNFACWQRAGSRTITSRCRASMPNFNCNYWKMSRAHVWNIGASSPSAIAMKAGAQ